MTRPEKPENKKRIAKHTVRFTEGEYAEMQAAAKLTHLSLTDFLRKAGLDECRRVHEAERARRR